jgi:hypothetical protein
VNDGKTQVFRAGEHWTEPPGAYHPISENASTTEPASLLAIFVVDTTDADRLVTYKRQLKNRLSAVVAFDGNSAVSLLGRAAWAHD